MLMFHLSSCDQRVEAGNTGPLLVWLLCVCEFSPVSRLLGRLILPGNRRRWAESGSGVYFLSVQPTTAAFHPARFIFYGSSLPSKGATVVGKRSLFTGRSRTRLILMMDTWMKERENRRTRYYPEDSKPEPRTLGSWYHMLSFLPEVRWD